MEKPKYSLDLYSDQILSLAAGIPLMERLTPSDMTITKRSQLCGSMVTVDVNMIQKIITDYSHDIKACALGQASASILATDIVGKTASQITEVRDAVFKMLNGSLYSLKIFPQYQVLLPAREFKNRHESIMLSLDAAVEAIKKINANYDQ